MRLIEIHLSRKKSGSDAVFAEEWGRRYSCKNAKQASAHIGYFADKGLCSQNLLILSSLPNQKKRNAKNIVLSIVTFQIFYSLKQVSALAVLVSRYLLLFSVFV